MNCTFERTLARPSMVGVNVAAAEPLTVAVSSSQKRRISPTFEARTVHVVGTPCAYVIAPERTFCRTGIAFDRMLWRIAMLFARACCAVICAIVTFPYDESEGSLIGAPADASTIILAMSATR